MSNQTEEQYLEVAIPVPMRQTFTYLLPTSLSAEQVKIGERVVVPFGSRQVIGIVLAIVTDTDYEKDKIKTVISRLDNSPCFTRDLVSFLKTCANYYHHAIGDVFQQALPVALRQITKNTTLKDEVVKIWFAESSCTNDEVTQTLKRSVKQRKLYQIINENNGMSWPELLTLGFSKAHLNALLEKKLIYAKNREVKKFIWQADSLAVKNKHSLTTEQALVVARVQAEHDHFSCHLLDGITGSGKTEVYLQAMEKALSASQQVLVLVPEIGLTPQMLIRFEQRFNVPIALHHSGLNNSERLQTWREAQQGAAAIVIGTRSAIFTPMPKLGLIIVDEEHDVSFKQQDSFRYHGRDMAILRARQLNIPIILGSATPSLETLHNALSGRYAYHQLTQRAGNASKAKIELIDLAQQQVIDNISGSVKQAIKNTLARDEQVLVFLNRRGYAPAIHCQECHWLAQCHRCNKSYTLHQSQGLLICHHCNSQKRIPRQCSECGSVRINALGQGTEQLAEKLVLLFPEYSAVRIDRDSTRKKGELAKLLQQVSNKEHHLLIGTQMLAKGHHFPNVTLVVVLDVDGALFSHDFRAAEHMAQLLVQVAGRAGRASKPGKVLVQSRYPEHPLLQDLIHNGYQHFAKQALSERQQTRLPPYSFQALFRAEANYPSYPEKFLRTLSEYHFDDCQFAGPMPAVMEKKAGKYRYHLILQAKSRQQLHQGILFLLRQINEHELKNKVRWSVDVDPIDLVW